MIRSTRFSKFPPKILGYIEFLDMETMIKNENKDRIPIIKPKIGINTFPGNKI